MDYSLYENIITKRLIYFSVVGVIVIILAIICIIWLFKSMLDQKMHFVILMILSCSAVVGGIILIGNVAYSSIYDIKNHAYISYEGKFQINTDVETRSGTCSLYLGDGTKLETDAYILESGVYEGKVVYGLKTKVVVDVQT